MAIRIYPKKHIKKARAGNGEEILKRLEEYLKNGSGKPIQILCGFWKDQSEAITYQELREAVKEGFLNEATFQEWSKDYSVLVRDQLSYLWKDALAAGSVSQPITAGLAAYTFNVETPAIMTWIAGHSAEFVTASVVEQKEAIKALLARSVVERHSVDELARFIRPCIGLTKPQAKANFRYYENIVKTLKEQHPRMKQDSIQRKAREAAAKYAEKQHRQRALTIAMTEMAAAYNKGADEGIRQAQEQNLIGKVIKRWSTSGDDAVCGQCNALEGLEIAMDSTFPFKGNWHTGDNLTPPAHPRCACAVEYIEEFPPIYPKESISDIKVSITQEESLREYTAEEIKDIAAQTEEIASKHISIPSKWSGNMVIDDKGIVISEDVVVNYGKLWDCDILTKHETAPSIILHEQIHARSISYFESSFYDTYNNIEEASVQLMTEEICKIEGIEIISSYYDEMCDVLRTINRRLKVCDNTYDFAKKLIEVPVTERLDWLSNKMYDILSHDETATLEEYQDFAEMLNTLY